MCSSGKIGRVCSVRATSLATHASGGWNMNRFRTIPQRIENCGWYSQASVALVKSPQFLERRIGLTCKRSEMVEKCQVVRFQRRIRMWHCAPDVPAQHLYLVQGGHFAHEVRRDEPQSSQIALENAKSRCVGSTCSAACPGIGCDQEPIARHIEYVVLDLQPVPPHFIELWIHQHPTLFRRIPIFADHVILEKARIEVRTETAAAAGRNMLGAQHGEQQHNKVAANTD